MSLAGLPAASSRVRMSLAKASASSKCVPCREKMTSALAAAKSRPVGESPAWKMTGCPCGLRGNVASSEMSNCDVEMSGCRMAFGSAQVSYSVEVAMASSAHESQIARAVRMNWPARSYRSS